MMEFGYDQSIRLMSRGWGAASVLADSIQVQIGGG